MGFQVEVLEAPIGETRKRVAGDKVSHARLEERRESILRDFLRVNHTTRCARHDTQNSDPKLQTPNPSG